jgi:ABC-type sugar transport system ATPase subunit
VREGRGIIMISSDLPEILDLTDRLLVLHKENLAATLSTAETTPDQVLTMLPASALRSKGTHLDPAKAK